MNTGSINSQSLNGGSSANWVVSATVLALAGLSSTVDAQRVVYASVNSSAVASVTLTEQHTILARSVGSSECIGTLFPTHTRAGASFNTAGSLGNGAVLRAVSGSSSADGTANGFGLVSSALGEVSTWAYSSGLAEAHIVFYGVANTIGSASPIINSVVTRMTTGLSSAVGSGYAEANLTLSGNSFSYLDGFSQSNAVSISEVRNDYSAIIATLGSFVFGTANGNSTGYTKFSGALNTLSVASGYSVGIRRVYGSCFDLGLSTSIADSTLIKLASASGVSGAVPYSQIAHVNYKAKSNHSGNAYRVSNVCVLTRYSHVSASSTAISNTPFVANHYKALSTGYALSTNLPVDGTFIWAGNCYVIGSANGSGTYSQHHKGSLNVSAGAFGSAVPAGHHKGISLGFTGATGISHPSYIHAGYASSFANVTLQAIGFSNTEVSAPESRSMIVEYSDRSMIVAGDNRSMIVGM